MHCDRHARELALLKRRQPSHTIETGRQITMDELANIKILFVAGFGPIVSDRAASRALYEKVLGIRFKEEEGGYLHTESLDGVKTFALWPLDQDPVQEATPLPPLPDLTRTRC